MSRTRFKRPETIHEPNMVPLIDVSLVLVVILLVATPMALQSGIAVSRAASSGRKAQPARTERVEINILGPDSILVNRLLVSQETFGFRVRTLLQASATRQVVVRCADTVAHGDFVAVLDEAKAQGAAAIAVVGR
ncbi:MAG: ExbD/TolR family protein [Candidatus Eiseniibacteriota bacterium]